MAWESRTFDVPQVLVEGQREGCPTCGRVEYRDPDKERLFRWIEDHHPVKVARTVGWSGGWKPGAETCRVTVRVRRA